MEPDKVIQLAGLEDVDDEDVKDVYDDDVQQGGR